MSRKTVDVDNILLTDGRCEGEPCGKCGNHIRYKVSNQCVRCVILRGRKQYARGEHYKLYGKDRYEKNRAKASDYYKGWYKRNRSEIRKQYKKRSKERRALIVSGVLPKYYEGTPCRKSGHTLRYTMTGQCVECAKDYQRRRK